MQHAQVAQLVEQRIENPRVGGSIPSLATTNSNRLDGGFCLSTFRKIKRRCLHLPEKHKVVAIGNDFFFCSSRLSRLLFRGKRPDLFDVP